MALGDLYRLTITTDLSGQNKQQHTLAFRQDSLLVLDTPAEDLIQAFQDEAEAALQAILNIGLSIWSYEARQIEGDGLAELVYGLGGPAGTRSGQALPLQVAAVLSLRTGMAGRSRRGRAYMPPASEGDSSSGFLESAYITDVNAYGAALQAMTPATVSHAAWTLGVYSTVLTQFTEVNSAIVDPVFGTQRRRRPGVGI